MPDSRYTPESDGEGKAEPEPEGDDGIPAGGYTRQNLVPEWLTDPEDAKKILPTSLTVAQFCTRYGWEAYWGTGCRRWNRRWPTSDGLIPWRLFFLMYQELRPLEAQDRLTQSSAVITALAQGFGKEHHARKMTERLEDEAYPKVPRMVRHGDN